MDADRLLVADFVSKHPFAAAQVLDGLSAEAVGEFIGELPIEKSLQLLGLMNIHKVAGCFAALPPQSAVELIENSDISFAELLCRHLDAPLLDRLLTSISPDLSSTLRQKLQQKPNTVGLLTEPVVGVNKEMNVKDALEIIKRNSKIFVSHLYIIDVQGLFKGAVKLNELLFAEQHITLGELMTAEIPRFFDDTPITQIQNDPVWYEYQMIPVTNRSEKLLGALHFKSIKENNPKKGGQLTKEILEVGTALGELYLIGLSGFLQSAGK